MSQTIESFFVIPGVLALDFEGVEPVSASLSAPDDQFFETERWGPAVEKKMRDFRLI
jgi:hypothetical protein